MTKVSTQDLKAFGLAVKRARSLKPWTLDELGAAINPPVGKSLISKIEKGRKETLNSRTVGRFIQALEMDETWIDRFLDTDASDDSDETKAERDADLIMDRAQRENVTEGASEELLIQLANTYAEGTHRDREEAYLGLRKALEAAQRIRQRGEMPPDNTGSQLNAVMAEVAKLNDAGELDDADALLDQEERRMREAHKTEQERLEQQAAAMLARRLDQDRLRNRPDLGAKRLVADLRQNPQAGKLFWEISSKADDWREKGDKAGDLFALKVGLELAKFNYERVKTKTGLAVSALYTLGCCHFRLAKRSANDRHLVVAQNAFFAAIKKTSRQKEPVNWSAYQGGLGVVQQELGERTKDEELLRLAVQAHRTALEIDIAEKSSEQHIGWESLANSLRALGELSSDAAFLLEAADALETALKLMSGKADKVELGRTRNNLALAQRWLGSVTADLNMLQTARQSFAACEALAYSKEAPFIWAMLQWNIADLALARHALAPDAALLVEARAYVSAARAFFVDGSDYQTQRCDDLLARIDQAEANLSY